MYLKKTVSLGHIVLQLFYRYLLKQTESVGHILLQLFYRYVPETNRVCRPYSAAAVLQLCT